MKGMPFEEQKLQPIKFPKPTVEEVVDKEPLHTTNPDAELIGPQDYPPGTTPVSILPVPETPKPSKTKSEPEMELKSVNLEELPNLEEGKLLITYLKGEPVIGILKQGQPPLMKVLGQHQNPTPWITCGLYKGTQRF